MVGCFCVWLNCFLVRFTVFRGRNKNFNCNKLSYGRCVIVCKKMYKSSLVNLEFSNPEIDVICVKFYNTVTHYIYRHYIYSLHLHISLSLCLQNRLELYEFLENQFGLYRNDITLGYFNIAQLGDHYYNYSFTIYHIECFRDFMS